MTSRVGPSYGVLERRLFFVRRKMNALEFVIENLPHALSQYTATQQPRFLWDARLSTEERTFAGVHEMVHAVLHPPGSTSVGEYETPVEERLAQHVANRTCEHFSVGDYMDFVELYVLGDAYIDDEECNGVELLLAALIETLEKPDDVPSWLGRDNSSFGITSLERAWAESIGG